MESNNIITLEEQFAPVQKIKCFILKKENVIQVLFFLTIFMIFSFFGIQVVDGDMKNTNFPHYSIKQ